LTTDTYTFERMGLDYGFMLYRTQIQPANGSLVLDPRDRAWVFLDGQYIGVMQRSLNTSISLPVGKKLDILVENMGRINYGPNLKDFKGIPGGVLWQGQYLFGWETFPIGMKDLSPLEKQFSNITSPVGPTFFRGTFTVANSSQILDCFMAMTGWTKGVAFINNVNLGRYWNIGPQYALYVPAAYLRVGVNEIIIFETEVTESLYVTLQSTPIFT